MTDSPPGPYPGPSDDDPLTTGKLVLLLAVPRAADSTPHVTLFRLPLGPEPLMGWVDVSCAEVHSILARLADVWKPKLFALLSKPGNVASDSIGPGMAICIATVPDFHGIFHLLAFWAIGCTVQYVSIAELNVAIEQLKEAGKDHFNGVILRLPESESADKLVQLERR